MDFCMVDSAMLLFNGMNYWPLGLQDAPERFYLLDSC